jgi:hypothetical protein
MRKATAIYHAPEGDAKSTTINGVIFNDGETVDLNSDDHPHLISKLENNQHFEFTAGEDEPDDKPRRGRPPGSKTRDFKASIDDARDHDFEQDRRDKLGSNVKPVPIPGPKPGADDTDT